MKVKDIIGAIEAFAPLGIQEEWDNSGLLIGSPETEIEGVLVGFDCTPALVEEAAAVGAGLIVTHHPLIFHGLKRISPEDPVGLAVMRAIRAGIAVYAAHTTADKVIDGVSGAMAAKLGLKEVRVLDVDARCSPPAGPVPVAVGISGGSMSETNSGTGGGEVGISGGGISETGSRRSGAIREIRGLGLIGDLPEPLTAEELIALVKARFSLKVLRTSRPVAGKISRVAVCGGSGGSLIDKARMAGAQLYLTGDISYHHFFLPEDYMIMDLGHFESEVDITGIFHALIKKKFPNFAVRISDNLYGSNPVYYF